MNSSKARVGEQVRKADFSIIRLRQFLESQERRVPELVEEVSHRGEALHPDRVDAARALRAVLHQAGVLEQAQVARDGGAADREAGRELADGERGGPQRGQDLAADGTSECVEGVDHW